MTGRRALSRSVDWLDDRLAAATLAGSRERPALLAFLFHNVFADTAEVAAERVWPSQPLQIGELRRFIEHFLAHGYRFVAPADIAAGLDPAGYHALLTFDDGYANNQLALPVLRELSVPATVFVSARSVADGRAFWWDVLYRERRRRGATVEAVRREMGALRRRAPEAIDSALRAEFGVDAMRPVSDVDRPLTAAELRALAADPLVTIGNHTVDHADLPYQDDARVIAEIRDCQTYLESVTGRAPTILAYPNGAYDARSIAAARAAGLRLAVTVGHHKTRLPLSAAAAMTIPRAFIPCGSAALPAACLRSRSDWQVRRWIESRARRAPS